jgi:hypothetical protein
VKGDDILDTVCIFEKETNCAKKFKFLAVKSVDASMLDIDGGFGLAPDDPRNGESFVTALFEQGVVSDNMFGVLLTPQG